MSPSKSYSAYFLILLLWLTCHKQSHIFDTVFFLLYFSLFIEWGITYDTALMLYLKWISPPVSSPGYVTPQTQRLPVTWVGAITWLALEVEASGATSTGTGGDVLWITTAQGGGIKRTLRHVRCTDMPFQNASIIQSNDMPQ